MPDKEVALEVAGFLDSAPALALVETEGGPSRDDVRRVAEAFLGICYEDLGKKPRLIDSDDVHMAVGHLLPGRLRRKDPIGDQVPAILRAWIDHAKEAFALSNTNEQRTALEGTVPELKHAIATGEVAHHGHHAKQAPLVHQAPKLGRNDPCFCGSGKKFKTCHGKAQ